MIVFIDNYDSFTYNLVSMVGALEPDLRVFRNDAVTVPELLALRPSGLILSPGPGTPAESGVCADCVRAFAPRIPVLGVCLGHQVMAEVFGAKVDRALRPVHGKASPVFHDGTGLLAGLPNPFEAGRYHSLAVRRESVSPCLQIQAATAEGEIMALRHRDFPCHGVQFHPESILTPDGGRLLANFVALTREAGRA